MGSDAAAKDAHVFIAALDEVDLTRFRVVGTYTRYGEAVRNALLDARQKILAGFEPVGRKRENHLIWAAPGSGKTYFVQQIAASLPGDIRYQELNLAKCTETEFRSGLGSLDGNHACLCLVDEIDAQPQEPWPYEVLLPYLDAAVDRGARFVFVMAGSSGAGLDELKQRISARPKGADFLSRIPTGHEYEIGPTDTGDRILIVLSQLRQAGQEMGREIRAVEKLGLYYVALNPRLANARQLREFAVRAVERVPRSDDRVKYDHLFTLGDPENKAFWTQALPVAERFVNTFVTLSERVEQASPARPRTNLPRHLTSFIGRDREIAEVKRLLPTARLLTLTGAGGCGKTRLALRVVGDLVDQYPDGAWVVELAALSDPALVPQTVASTLSVREQSGRPLLTTLAEFLQPKHVLLVLDNCEHLVAACGHLVEALLRACPNLRILATSREALSIPGEAIWRVPSLALPDPRGPQSPEAIAGYEAVRLFIERAVFSQPGFAISCSNAPAVVHVCNSLDGIPLAIELAAARVKVLAVEQIAARLDDRFRLLTGGSRTALPRHRTLRAAMDWSYDLLQETERVLLRRLSVFAGGWTLEAAEAICPGDGVEKSAVLDLLTQLVDKSLLVVETQNGEARYRLLETVRQYGRDRLAESGESERMRTGHLDFFLGQAEAVKKLSGPAVHVWRQRMETEHENMRAALEWSRAKGDTEATLRLATALDEFWDLHGYWSEGRKWLEPALAATSGVPSSLRGQALEVAGMMAWSQGDIGCAAAQLEESAALRRELGDKKGLVASLKFLGVIVYRQGDYGRAGALLEESLGLSRELGEKEPFALYLLGIVARLRGDYERAEALGRESLALNRELGRTRGIALSTDSLGLLAYYRGNYTEAQALCEEGLALFRKRGDKFGIAGSLNSLALVACGQGDYNRADALCQESLALSRETSDKGAMARSLNVLGRVADSRGEHERGLALLRESLTLFRGLDDKLGIIRCLEGLAGVAWVRDLPEQAARIFGAAESLRESIGAALPLAEQSELEENVSALRARLGERAFTSAWAEGRAMTQAQAVEYALAT